MDLNDCLGKAKSKVTGAHQNSDLSRLVSKGRFLWRNNRMVFYGLCLIFGVLFTLGIFQPPPLQTRIASVPYRQKELILLYTSFFDTPDWGLGPGNEVFEELDCPVRWCTLTTDRGLINEAPVVVFHVPALKTNLHPPARSPTRKQAWVFFSQESPSNSHQPPYLWQRLFDWSMTYHPDADIPFPYGRVTHQSAVEPKNYAAVAKEPRKMAVWFVSNCNTNSKRDIYVERLKKHVPIDIYGKCGDHQCDEHDSCLGMIGKTYKFYLALEDTFCDEYVTEKYFWYAPLDLVMVVRGGANYSRFAPPNSFINTADFASPEELGKYLTYLGSHPDEYAKYLDWKNYYETNVTISNKDTSWCELCEQAHDVTRLKPRHNPYDFWFREKVCWTPTDV